ncbi:hypothetical protein DPMN_023262 [Dreissena polymorpha]|uniref:EF-hand domain-containing protein n=1 Tax=Dreissena polymorpha TaxID=45954 RepID=A0A9D4LMC3_DREPO|nr:hypothetical protein DPMN_023262 [Dreissena polymorpha]
MATREEIVVGRKDGRRSDNHIIPTLLEKHRDELLNALKACMEESSLSLSAENLEDLTDALFDAADEDKSGTITFEELRNEIEKHPGVIENLTFRWFSAMGWSRALPILLDDPDDHLDSHRHMFSSVRKTQRSF